jgi:CDP-glucose 4,6-dehydratase
MAKDGFWKGRRVFVTGATGLVGSWLCGSLIENGAELTCLVRDRVPNSKFFMDGMDKKANIISGQLEDYFTVERSLNEYEPQTIIHLGAQAIVSRANRSPIHTFKANIEGTWNLLEAARQYKGMVSEIVVASSDKAYGDQDILPYKEDAPLDGSHPYDVSKSCVDLISKAYAKSYGLPITISRCGNFFGGGDLNFNRIVPGTIRSVLKNERPIIRSDGKYVRDYIYVLDAVSAYITLAEKTAEKKLAGEAFNFSNEEQLTVLEMVDRVLKAMGSPLKPIVKNEASNEIVKQHLSSEKAQKVLGWKAKWGIDDGLKETVKWYKANLRD